jgi:hypothetical protein
VARATKTKRRREGGLDVPHETKTEGRHVGLDFYDLLIEAIEAAAEATKLSELSV